MKKLIFPVLLSLAFVFIWSACSSSKSVSEGKGDITALEWRLVSVLSVDGNQELTPVVGSLPTILVNKAGEVMGNTGCNGFSGSVNVDKYSLKFGPLVMTRKFCEGRAEVENAFTSALENTDNYTVESGNLLLRKGTKVLATLTSFRE